MEMGRACFWPNLEFKPIFSGSLAVFRHGRSAGGGWRVEISSHRPQNPSEFFNWRYVFEKIRTDFARDWLAGRKGKDRTPIPPASP
jgi:hypothetical protein